MSEQRAAAERGAIETMTINMGPSHPSTHGVLRLVLELDGETVVSCKPDLGYLHRGFEKIAENKTWQQFVTWTDRMDYLAPVSNNVAYVLAVEKLLGLEIPPRARAMRVILCEMARVSAHLLWLGTHALDLGAATVFFYTFQQREYLYDLFEQLTGARMTTSTVRIGGMSRDVPPGWPEKLAAWNKQVPAHYDEMEGLLTRNRIWLDRTQNVGVISLDQAKALEKAPSEIVVLVYRGRTPELDQIRAKRCRQCRRRLVSVDVHQLALFGHADRAHHRQEPPFQQRVNQLR